MQREKPPLRDEDCELLDLLLEGLSVGEVADKLTIGLSTAEYRIGTAKDVLGVATLFQLGAAYIEYRRRYPRRGDPPERTF